MPGTDDQDDLVEFDEKTRVDDGQFRIEPPPKPASSVSLDGESESTRFVAPPTGARGGDEEDEEPVKTVMIESPFQEPAEPPAPVIPEGHLVVVEGNDRGKDFRLTGEPQVVGRSLDSSIVLNDATVSRRHFQVEYADGMWRLTDLGSGNGTRVNDEKVPGIELLPGMRISIGQTVLAFAGPEGAAGDEECTRAVEVPAELPRSRPEPAPVRRAQPVAAPEEIRARKAPRIEVENIPPADTRRFPVWPVVGGAVAAVLIALALAQFVFGVRILPIGEAPTSPAAGSGEETARADAEALKARALKAIEQRQWDPALRLLASAREAYPDLEGLEAAASRAQEEKQSAALLAAAQERIAQGATDEARGMLQRVPDSSVYHPDAQKALGDLDASLLDGRISGIRAKVKEGKKADAKQAYLALVTEHPEDPRVVKLRDELASQGIALEPPAPRPAAAHAASASPTPSPAGPAPAASSRPGRLDFPKAFAAYDRGAFGQASQELRTARAKGDDLARAREMADRIDRFAEAFADGKSALDSKRLDRAEAGLSQALRLDLEVNGHYGPEIRSLLGDTYRGRAAAAIQNADYALAARSARRALSYRGEDGLARSILDKCLVMAQKQYDSAVAASKAGRKDEARQKARLVLDILDGTKGHPLEEKAAALMK